MIVDAILVPQGAEYKSVCRGLKIAQASLPAISIPPVFAIPMGVKPAIQYMEKWLEVGHLQESSQPKVLLMGLCGSLIAQYSVGDLVLYDSCTYKLGIKERTEVLTMNCDRTLNNLISNKLKDRVSLVNGFTSDRIIYTASEKHHLAGIYNTEVVDMEGFATLEMLTKANMAVAMLRVISDDSQHNLPDITSAINPDGSLKTLPLAIGMLRQPIAASRLITGALRGLQMLEKAAKSLIL